ncbi:MAG: insulinase family protein [Candidatus Moranbacteria bacterium]|nr:insulinase family protein [Candidatus Moranbacteria bacterium]
MKFQKITLKNGLRIILAPMQDTDTATVLIMTGVGSRYETRSENGLAHFLEHMFFKGTEKRPTALDISKELDGLGAEYNAFTGEEYTGYYAKVASKHWMTALDVVSDLFLNAKLEQEEIDRERGAILQELNMRGDIQRIQVEEHFKKLLYGDTPLGWSTGGPKENIKSFMRKDFIKFLDRAYVAPNIVVGVAGKIDSKIVRKEIEKIFANVREGKKPAIKKAADKQSVPGVIVQNKKTDQTHVVVGVRAFDMFHKDRATLSVLSTILGGGMSSRLFIEVRERRGLVYTIRTGAELFLDAGYLSTYMGVEHENIEKALRVVLDEYKKIATEAVGKDELKKAKESIKGRMALGLEGSDDVVEYLVAQEVLQDKIVLPKDKVKAIDRVTAEDVLRVAKMIFTDKRLNIAVIGPEAKQTKLEKLLHL